MINNDLVVVKLNRTVLYIIIENPVLHEISTDVEIVIFQFASLIKISFLMSSKVAPSLISRRITRPSI